MAEIPVFQVDSFTSERFRGNPAAICLLDDWLEDQRLQAIASEMNLSETAFLRQREEGEFDLRWMTPTVEVDLCGHATLAAAHVLWTQFEQDDEPSESNTTLGFHTRSGRLTARRRDGQIELDFPSAPAISAAPPDGLLEALGLGTENNAPEFCGWNNSDWLLAVDSEATVRQLDPDFRLLTAIRCRGAIVTARADADADYDFVSRFFGPAAGIDEDPVTGSAHCCLSPFWSERLGRTTLVGWQASSRGGRVTTENCGERVKLRGDAVTTLRGVLMV